MDGCGCGYVYGRVSVCVCVSLCDNYFVNTHRCVIEFQSLFGSESDHDKLIERVLPFCNFDFVYTQLCTQLKELESHPFYKKEQFVSEKGYQVFVCLCLCVCVYE